MRKRKECCESGQCIIIISHSNYRIRSAGTEKYISDMAEMMVNDGRDTLQIFPLVDLNDKLKRVKYKIEFVGINYNGCFQGVCRKEKVLEYIRWIGRKEKVNYELIQLHHLAGWDLLLVDSIIKSLQIPVIMFVHDYYMLCPYLSSHEGGLTKWCSRESGYPIKERCYGCKYEAEGMQSYEECRKFLCAVREYIAQIIAPSDFALRKWQDGFPFLNGKCVVRAHLSYNNLHHYDRNVNRKMKIAFLGGHLPAKGYNEWNGLVDSLAGGNYEFYNYSKTSAGRSDVTDVMVDFQDRESPGMVELLKQNNIDIAFLWSILGETYSYTTFEAYEAGCYIVTNKYSGNIAEHARSAGCGKVFRDLEECLEWFRQPEKVYSCLQVYADNNMIPVDVKPNDSRSELYYKGCITDVTKCLEYEKKRRYADTRNIFFTYMYKWMKVKR